ncbi:MAG: TonB-dependent receptor, partial [Proteobacteria bacterium]
SAIEHTIEHITINAGIRAEQTFSKGYLVSADQHFSREYFGIFPSLFILRPINERKGSTLSVGYNRRLTRPAMNDLNPARMVFSRYTALVGNPNILPEYSNNFSVTYVFVKNHSVDVYFSRSRNAISLSVKPGEDNSIDYYSANTGSASQYGINYSGSSSSSKAWTITNNLSAYRSDYTFGDVPYKQTSFSVSSVHVFSFAKFGDIDLIAGYRSPYIYTNLYTYGNVQIDFGVTKKLVKEKVRVRLACTDVLNSSREKELTNEKGTRLEFYRKRPTRTLRLSLTYNFSKGKKMADKKIDHSSADEKSRGAN